MSLYLQGYSLGGDQFGGAFTGVGNDELIIAVEVYPNRWGGYSLTFKPRTISEVVRVSLYSGSSGSATGTSIRPLDQDFQYPTTSGLAVYTQHGGSQLDLIESYYVDTAKKPVLYREWRYGLADFRYRIMLNTGGERYDVKYSVFGWV